MCVRHATHDAEQHAEEKSESPHTHSQRRRKTSPREEMRNDQATEEEVRKKRKNEKDLGEDRGPVPTGWGFQNERPFFNVLLFHPKDSFPSLPHLFVSMKKNKGFRFPVSVRTHLAQKEFLPFY